MPRYLVTMERPAERWVGDVVDNSPERYVVEVDAQDEASARYRVYDADRVGTIVAVTPA